MPWRVARQPCNPPIGQSRYSRPLADQRQHKDPGDTASVYSRLDEAEKRPGLRRPRPRGDAPRNGGQGRFRQNGRPAGNAGGRREKGRGDGCDFVAAEEPQERNVYAAGSRAGRDYRRKPVPARPNCHSVTGPGGGMVFLFRLTAHSIGRSASGTGGTRFCNRTKSDRLYQYFLLAWIPLGQFDLMRPQSRRRSAACHGLLPLSGHCLPRCRR
jgi:hypothetical protein